MTYIFKQIARTKYIRTMCNSYVFGLFATLMFSIISIASRIFQKNSNGSLGFNLNSLSDDGQIYLYKQLQFSNIPRLKIDEIVSLFYPNNEPVTDSMIRLSATRPIYPFITAFFGNPSFIKLLIVPIISYLIINFILFHILNKKLGIMHALVIIFFFNNSFYIKYNLITNTTEAIANLFYIIFLISLIWNRNFVTLTIGASSAVLAIYSRPIDLALFLPCLFLLVFSRRKMDRYFSIIILLITTLHTFSLMNSIEYNSTNFINSNFSSEKPNLLDLISRYLSSIFIEVFYSLLFDGFAVIILVLGIYAIRKMHFRYKYIYIGTFLSTSILNIVSGGSGKGLRYFIPLILISIIFYAESMRRKQIIIQ